MGGETLMPERFTLNEPAAREWLAAQAASPVQSLDEDYNPLDPDDNYTTEELIADAQAGGVITGPGTIIWHDEGDGYHWAVDLGTASPDEPMLRIAGLYTRLDWLLKGNAEGTGAAFAVLQEATRAGNELLAQLSLYVQAARP
jgi:hypothetical protein